MKSGQKNIFIHKRKWRVDGKIFLFTKEKEEMTEKYFIHLRKWRVDGKIFLFTKENEYLTEKYYY